MTELAAAVAQSLRRINYQTWSFGESIAMEAMWEYGSRTGNEDYRHFVHGYLRGWAARAEPYARLDCTAPGRLLVECYRATKDELLLAAALGLARYLSSRPKIGGVFATWDRSPLVRPCGQPEMSPSDVALLADPPAGVFVDCLDFDPPLYAALGRVLQEPRWTQLAIAQATGYIDQLQQPDGLFDHFVLDGIDGSFGPGWGRGQGWALLGLLDVAAELQPGDESAGAILEAVARNFEGVIRYQRADGHWPAVMTRKDTSPESSTAAFLAVAISRFQMITGRASVELTAAGERALTAVRASLQPDGVLTGVSAAVNASTVAEHYSSVPTGFVVPWGQGPALLALMEWPPRNTQQPGPA